MKKPIVALYSSNGFQETFTKAHKELLPIKYFITEGTPPRMVNDKPMLPMDKWSVFIRKLKMIFGKKIQPLDPLEYFLSRNEVNLFIAEFGMAGVAVLPSCKKFKIPLVVNFYGIDAFGKKVIDENKEKYVELFNYASLISVQSISIKNQLIYLGCSENKIVVNTCPPSDAFFNLKPELTQLNLISIGRFVEKKAPHLVVKAFKEVVNVIPESKLTMVGDGPLLEDTILLSTELGIRNSINFAGYVNPDEQVKLMMDASVFVQHSITAKDGDSEGIPVAIMEASAMGLPIVSTFHSGIPEAVEHEVTGFLVDEYDFRKMSEYIIDLLKSEDLRRSLGENGRKKMKEKFTMNIHISKSIDIINRVAND